jgi:glycosyltransferase involved in cell wall biosynthesis
MKFDIVTPTLNQVQFLPWTINSIQNQDHDLLRMHTVIDGGSQDGTLDFLPILKSINVRWESFNGMTQSQALNLGFKESKADFLAYLNSDDVYLEDTLSKVKAAFDANPDVDFVYHNRIIVDENNRIIGIRKLPRHTRFALLYAEFIPQETIFWRRKTMDDIGYFSSALDFAMDYDFVVRLIKNCKGMHLNSFSGAFRMHVNSKTTKNYYTLGKSEILSIKRIYKLPNLGILILFFSKLQIIHGKFFISFLGTSRLQILQSKILQSIRKEPYCD